MGKAFGDPEKLEITAVAYRLKVEARPPAKLGRVAAKIDSDVPDVSRENTNEFSLRQTKLVVESAEDPLAGKRLIVLGELGRKTCQPISLAVEDLGKPPSVISESTFVNQFNVLQRRSENLHKLV